MNADNVQVTEDPSAALPASPEGHGSEESSPIETAMSQEATPHEPNLQETLLEGVSPDALTLAAAEPTATVDAPSESGGSAPVESEPAEPVSAVPVAEEPQAAPAEDLTVVPEAAAESVPDATVDVASAAAEAITEPLPETVGEALPESVAATIPEAVTRSPFLPVPALMDFRGLLDLSKAPHVADMMGEFGEVNATVFSYLRGEGTAALAHWQALFGAKTPADAIRLQVDEIQRAADASLNCFSTLAQRASRFTGSIRQA